MIHSRRALAAAISLIMAQFACANDNQLLEEIVVTGARMDEPLTVVTDPKAPRQPLPANDGADYLKTIPGFSVIRKGGTDGDPVFRGMAGSRLSLVMDGESMLGGCSNRMDPPTAYIFPETYDSIKIVKGPQSVQYGPGNSAGVVLFEREHYRLAEAGWKFNGSALAGSFGRTDEVIDVTGGTPDFYLRGTGTYARQGDYTDGAGVRVHSRYERWNTQFAGGWTPSENTTLEVSGGRSDGEAAYADRNVDGAQFARSNAGLKLIMTDLGPVWNKLEAQAYYNYVDHVMDNFSLRTPTGNRMAMNPDRETIGGRIVATLLPLTGVKLVVGLDAQDNEHTNRQTMNQDAVPYQSLVRLSDASFLQVGIFGEATWTLDDHQRVVGGLRADRWHARDNRENVALTMMLSVPNPTAGETRNEILTSGFIRYERDLSLLPATAYAGVGHSERFPDYWELISKETPDSVSAFDARPEKTTQLDVGLVYKAHRFHGSLSAFYNEIDDFLLIQTGVMKPAGMGGMRSATVTRNIQARSWGMEADASYALTHTWSLDLTLSSVRGDNKTDHTTLPQLPPLEMRLGLRYDNETWSFGTLWRLVAAQTRFDLNKGNIAGQDIGPTPGFGILSFNGGWRPTKKALITAGVDNVLDKTYAEFVSKGGVSLPGFDQTTRVNEPGRTFWLKGQLSFD